jgi:hypothetical protein
VQTDLLHGVGDIEPRERQVLESACDAPELGGILYQRPGVCSKLHLEVDRSVHGLQSTMTARLMTPNV